MRWRKRSEEAIQCEGWIISRTRHGGSELYSLWRGNDRVGIYNTAESAKREAKKREKAE